MGGSCPEGEYEDALVKRCLPCHMVCHQSQINSKCNNYCVSARCKALPGRFYDMLLRKCVTCHEVCGGHPPECSPHCQSLSSHERTTKLPITSAPSRPVTTKKLLIKLTSHIPNSRGLEVSTALDDSTVLLYSLLAVCMVLLLSSLSLALAVFLRGARAKTTKQGPKAANHSQERVIQPGQEVGLLSGQLERSSKDFVTNSSRPTDREPLEDSSPTETCVCVHCFPDLTALGQGNDRPLRAPYSFNQQAVPLQTQIQNGRPSCTGESLRTTGLKAQAEAAVG
ncbi:tumor necrosis factor receptor superfamily member 13B [Thunnus albacares]|uniref:tumor necrosis factor receptor superfamily member 13B n=1 Tax=Thunnus albacares TaxID=8236 RepID=UPI001CF68E4C|nr:tumor necrosis factor receptor superfamily member 13B [Thunnus albacares]XP_044194500.1 tumor necrosis factor receptor superfamily member 13B [Thunnus albacares]